MGDSCNKSFAGDYMLLSHEDAGPMELIKILFRRDVQKRSFVNCPEGKEKNFDHRWIIFVSILVQKILQLVAKPLAWFGAFLEMWLNLLSSNRNLLVLFFNILRGKVVIPDKDSASFSSIIAYTDQRLDLDKNIKPGDSKYYGALAIMAAKVSYENKAFVEATVKDHWKMDFLGSFDFWNEYQEKATTQAFLFRDKTVDPELIVVAFRGTEPFSADDWCADIDISWYALPGIGKMHGGFMKALGLQKNTGWPKDINRPDKDGRPQPAYYAIRKMLRELLHANHKARFIVTGHSLGGALAILFPAVLLIHKEEALLEKMDGVYTFGQPRVGDDKFGEFMKEQLTKHVIPYYRFVYSNDIVPRLPYDDSYLLFKHFGPCMFFNSLYEGKVLIEEPDKNYFSVVSAIPKRINAFWEVIRSFILPCMAGVDYVEGFVLRAARLFGLIIVGIPNHCPQDYVNSTRLGSLEVYHQVNDQKHHKTV